LKNLKDYRTFSESESKREEEGKEEEESNFRVILTKF